ncbi:hypothetical protein N7470_010026 [Penicillium chermesinum]|nr:hypothetical protein N7470_010026 [Penicillium chermesinum]
MQYSLLALSAALLATSGSAQMMPMPISNAYAPSVESFQPTPTPISTPAQASPASPMSASASASYNPMLYQHYYLTPKAKVSTFHKIASYSMSASMSIAASASASARPSSSNPALHHSIAHAANSPHGMRKPHPKEGFPMPAGLSGLQSTPDVESFNGATTKHGGYTGGNGNEENISHDGSPMPGYGPDVPAEQPIPYASDSSLRSGSEEASTWAMCPAAASRRWTR